MHAIERTRALAVDQLVAHTPDRRDQLRRQLAPQIVQMHLDRVAADVGVPAVDGGFELHARDDTGPGIAPANRERVFDRFERLGRKTPDGVGLGMVIVLSVVKAHEARLELLDSPLGGLRVTIEFPQPDVR